MTGAVTREATGSRQAGGLLDAVLRAPVQPRTRREYAHAVVGSLLAVPPFLLAVLGGFACLLSPIGVGLPLLAGVLAVARHAPRYYRTPAWALLGVTWELPPPLRARGPQRTAVGLLRDGGAWRALAYCALALPLRVAVGYPAAVCLVIVPAAVTLPLTWPFLPAVRDLVGAPGWAATLPLAASGVAVLLALPWPLRLLAGVDSRLAVALLGSDPQVARIAELEAARTALRDDAAAVLRRVERDLHDGPQARLVALGLTLERLEGQADGVQRPALADARRALLDTLAELRDVVRSIHPPALDDGLGVALETLAGRSDVPVTLSVALRRPTSQATAAALYFTAGELLANVVRHAAATRAELTLREDEHRLHLSVCDDGRGGAAIAPDGPPGAARGSGLAGLARRAQALDGMLTVTSPVGGPTSVTLTLPSGP